MGCLTHNDFKKVYCESVPMQGEPGAMGPPGPPGGEGLKVSSCISIVCG